MSEDNTAVEEAEDTASKDIGIEVEGVDEVTKKIKVSVTANFIDRRYSETISQYKSQANIKGFRKGKAPKKMLDQLYGDRIKAGVFEEVVREALQKISTEHQLNMVGTPEVGELEELKLGQAFEFSMSVSLYPEPELKEYEKFEVSVEKSEVEDQNIDEVVNRILDSKATIKALEDAKAEKGNLVSAKMKVVGEEDAATEPFHVVIGDGSVPEELEQGLIGMGKEDEKEIEVNFPEDHPNEGLRGIKNVYHVIVESVSEKILPELSDAFVKTLNYEGVETVIELKLDVRKRLEKEAEEQGQHSVRAAILEQLLERNDFLVPQALVDDEIRAMLAGSGYIDPEKIDLRKIDVAPFREQFGPEATKRVKMTVAVDRLAELLDCKADDDDINEHIDKLAERHNLPADEVRRYFLGQDQALNTFMDVTRDKVMSALEERATVNYT